MTRPSIRWRCLLVLCGWSSLADAEAPAELPLLPLAPVFVTATRTGEAADEVPFSHQTLTGADLRAAPNATVDGLLRGISGFSLFRRTDSLVANPTTQGVSLRGLGPSGTSRSLVLLDGVPLNDPFGGWVLWSKVPRESLARIELVPGAGGTAWGNAAIGGVIQLLTEPALGAHERLAVRAGSFHTHEAEGQVTEPVGSGTLQVLGRTFSTDGFFTVAPETRGPIDQPVSSRAQWVTGRWRQSLGADTVAVVTVRRFGEERGNGTPYQRNRTAETFASLDLRTQVTTDFHWVVTAYAQSQDFSSTFSSVNATRTAETPASNQFAVPATALGWSWVGEWTGPEDARTSLGFDTRDVRGETREDSGFAAGAFTRRRFAGGRQTSEGLFLTHSRTVTSAVRATVGLRADDWQDTDGHLRDFLNGAPAGDQRFPYRSGLELSPSAGVVGPLGETLRWHASAQQAFRRPTLNELYRPFRVGNVITDANPALRTESVTSGEIGVEMKQRAFDFAVTAFHNDLHDAVANVTIANGPATVPGIGFIPAGGQGRRRLNLDRTVVQGIEVSAEWRVVSRLVLTSQYLLDETTVTRATVAPQLVGLRLAQVPRHSASVGAAWKSDRWSASVRARYVGVQFDDDANLLALAPATIIDASIRFAADRDYEFFLNVENLADHRIETGRTTDGLVNTGTPRLISVGVRFKR